jgi:hypothetical protein
VEKQGEIVERKEELVEKKEYTKEDSGGKSRLRGEENLQAIWEINWVLNWPRPFVN